MSTFLPIVFAVYPTLVAGAAIVWLGLTRERRMWWIRAPASASVVGYLVLAAPWSFSSVHLRLVVVAGFLIAVLTSRHRSRCGSPPAFRLAEASNVLAAAVLLTFLVLCGFALASRVSQSERIELQFPFGPGTYSVLQGGSNAVTNPFHAASGSPYALDLVKLGRAGNRARGLAPRDLSAYEIFGEELYSPCEGIVLRVLDGLLDTAPGHPDFEHPAGNHVVLSCSGAAVVLGHLKRASITVQAGDDVRLGELLGAIGNSGNSLEPHLHLAATKRTAPVVISFGGRTLTVNDVIRIGTHDLQ